jgi:hypothetical protein
MLMVAEKKSGDDSMFCAPAPVATRGSAPGHSTINVSREMSYNQIKAGKMVKIKMQKRQFLGKLLVTAPEINPVPRKMRASRYPPLLIGWY